jgi:hypothetical protein
MIIKKKLSSTAHSYNFLLTFRIAEGFNLYYTHDLPSLNLLTNDTMFAHQNKIMRFPPKVILKIDGINSLK